MKIYSIKNSVLKLIKENPFRFEREIQSICENNLNGLFDLELVKSEFSINNFRIDSLAYNSQSKSFCIIEYKRDKNFSVVDQGYAYLSLMLNNKADFILEYNENCKNNLKRDDIDWTQSKVMFISPSFTVYQKESINFKDLPIELWEIKKYDNDTISLFQLQTSGATESIKTISKKSKDIEAVSKIVRVYTEDDHLVTSNDDVNDLYQKLKMHILGIGDDISIKPVKFYIGFVASTNVVDIHIQKKSLKMWINLPKGELEDPKDLMRDVSSIGHWGNGDYEIQLKDDQNIDHLMMLVKQSYDRHKK